MYTRIFYGRRHCYWRGRLEVWSQSYINSLAWYHNGTQVTADDRVHIINNGTELTISNVVQSDAGKYEVKIDSIEYARGSSGRVI